MLPVVTREAAHNTQWEKQLRRRAILSMIGGFETRRDAEGESRTQWVRSSPMLSPVALSDGSPSACLASFIAAR